MDPALCGNKAPALHGDMTADAALAALLKNSRCRASRLDDRAFLLRRRVFFAIRPATKPTVPPTAETPAGEVIITATRRAQLAGNTPFAVSVLTQDELQTSGHDLSAVSSRIAGFSLTNLGPGRDKILLRGLSDGVFTGRTQSTVGLYLDDVPITYNAPDPDLFLADMSRVEVLKGPQGALYGEGSISGVVRLVTNGPDLANSSASLSATVGATQGGDLSRQFIAVGNLAAVPDTFALRMVAYDDRQGGYIDNLDVGAHNINLVRRTGGRASMLWCLSPAWKLGASYAAQEINARDSQYVTGNVGAYHRPAIQPEPHDNDFNSATISLTGKTALGEVKLTAGHLHHDVTSRYDVGAAATMFGSGAATAYDQDQAVELSTQEISLTSPADRRWRWMTGVFSSKSIERFIPAVSAAGLSQPLFVEQRRDDVTNLAVFGEVAVDLSPKVTLALGLRQSHGEHAVSSRTSAAGAPELVMTDHLVSDRLSHQASIRYRPSDNLTVYLLTSEGYRNGGFNTTHLPGTVSPPALYSGDELNSYEAGAKWRWPEQGVRLSVAAYRVYWRNLQSDQLQVTGLPMTVNIGNGTNTGLELEAEWRPVPSLQFHAAGLFNEPKLTRPNPDFVTDEDAGLPYIARHSYSLGASWETAASDGQLRASATYAWRGRSRLNFGPLQTVEMGGYGRLDLSATLQSGPVTYGLRVDNAAGATGNSFAYGNPFSLGRVDQRTPERPRTVWINVTRAF